MGNRVYKYLNYRLNVRLVLDTAGHVSSLRGSEECVEELVTCYYHKTKLLGGDSSMWFDTVLSYASRLHLHSMNWGRLVYYL